MNIDDVFPMHVVDTATWERMYTLSIREPRFPVPAIPLQVKYDYVGCVNIDDVTDPEDPIIVYMWCSWDSREVTREGGCFHGK